MILIIIKQQIGHYIDNEGMVTNMTDNNTPSVWWRMKNKRLVRVSDMTYIHLVNTINMLRRGIDGSSEDDSKYYYIQAMEDELDRRQNGGM